MKNIDELARELAKIYDIEVIETPNSHCFVKDNGDIIPFGDPSFWDAFGISFSDRLPYAYENSTLISEETVGFVVKPFHPNSFKSNSNSLNAINKSDSPQYAKAA